jgi:hypothetical protein
MIHEPRCIVCGSPLDKAAWFEKTIRKSEVCSDECLEIYLTEEGITEECDCGYYHSKENCPFKRGE